MLAAVLTDQDYALMAPTRGQFPVQTLVLGASAWARVELLPALAITASEGLNADSARTVLALVARHRDTLLTAWAAPAPGAPPGAPDGPRANGLAYDAARKALAVRLNGGTVLTLPAAMIPGLAEADPAAAAEGAVMAGGEAIVWRRLGLYVRVADLVLHATGGPAWRERLASSVLPPWNAPPRPAGVPQAVAGRPAPVAGAMVKSLIGLILQRENYLTADQVNAVFRRQLELRQAGRELSFGEVAIEAGLLSPERVQFAVHLQERLAHGPEGGKPLGVYLLESAAVMPSHLLAAMEEQKATGKRLGEVLIERGVIGRHLLDEFLMRQREVRGEVAPAAEPVPAAIAVPAPEQAPEPATVAAAAPAQAAPPAAAPELPKIKSLLGIILEREGYVSQNQVRQITDEQESIKAGGRNITFGEVAMNLKLLTADQLRFAIGLQKRLAYDPGKPKPLGLLLLENGVLKPSQVQLALEVQARTDRRLGEILIEQGLISEGMLDVFLNMQKQQT